VLTATVGFRIGAGPTHVGSSGTKSEFATALVEATLAVKLTVAKEVDADVGAAVAG